MTKRILMALALVAGMAGAASAQTITASATVRGYFDDIGSQGMVFGEVAADATSETSAGFMDYRYNRPGTTVDVEVTEQPTLDATGEELSLAIQCADAAVADPMPAAGVCEDLTLDHDRGMVDWRVWVSGTLTGMSTVSAGDYEGTITFVVSHL